MGAAATSRHSAGGGARHSSRGGWLLAAYVLCAIWLGGGGTPNPSAEIALQAIAVLLALVWIASRKITPHRIPRSAWWLAALILVVPIIQLIPLPPVIWQAMPGRALDTATLELIGAAQDWRSWSISPSRTLASLMAMLPAVGAMLAATTLDRNGVKRVLQVIVVSGLLMAVLGALQLATDDAAFRFYEQTHTGWITGSFANRNAAVDFFLIAGLTASYLYRETPADHRRPMLLMAVQAMLLAAVIFTGSRAGILLIALVAPLHWLLLRRTRKVSPVRSLIVVEVAVVAVLAIGALAANGSGRLGDVADRFTGDGDLRHLLWRDTWDAIVAYWPMGSGIGTFQPAFLPYERLEAVDATFPNRAHNEYLELLLEAGLFAPLILLAIAIILTKAVMRIWSEYPTHRSTVIFAVGSLSVMALHGLVDYPFRTMALSTLGGILAGMILRSGRTNGPPTEQKRSGHEGAV